MKTTGNNRYSPVSGYMSKKEFKMFLIEGTAYFKENEGKVSALSKKSDDIEQALSKLKN